MEAIGRHRAPGWGGRLDAETEEAQKGLEENGLRNAEGGLDDDRAQRVGQDVAGQKIFWGGGGRPGRPRRLPLPEGKRLAPPPSRPLPPPGARRGGDDLFPAPAQEESHADSP